MDEQITSDNIHLATDEDCREQVSCFGVGWDPYDAICQNECGARARCLYAVAFRHLPQLAKEMGHSEVKDANTQVPIVDALNPEEVAGMTGAHPFAAQYAKQVYAQPELGLPVMQPDGTFKPSMDGPPPGPPGSGAAIAGGTSELVTDSQLIEDAAAKNDITEGEQLDISPEYAEDATGKELESVLQNLADSEDEPDVAFADDAKPDLTEENEEAVERKEEEAMPKKTPTKKKVVKKKVTKKTAAAKKTTKKKVVKKKAPAAKKKATTKKSPSKKATTKKAPSKKATTKKAAAKKEAPKGKGDPTFASRFQRDLQKPYLSDLKWGTKLKRTTKDGTEHVVTLTKEGFKYEGETYPTLYAVQLEIEGHPTIGGKVQTSMSAKRFFNLGEKS